MNGKVVNKMIANKKIVSLCTSRIFDPENGRFIKELSEKLKEENSFIFIYNINTDLYWSEEKRAEAYVYDLVDFDITDVLIVMYEKVKSDRITERLIEAAREKNVPVIIVDSSYEGCVNICYDYSKGFEDIIRHVIDKHGAKDIRLMAGMKGNPFSDEREEVFKRVMRENGLPLSEKSIKYGNFWAKPAISATKDMLKNDGKPDAVICANDIMAINVCSVFREFGYSIPDDVIITGFDGIDEISFSSPKITSAYCGSPGFVDPIIKAIKLIYNDKVFSGDYRVAPEVIFNESCGCDCEHENSSADILRSFNDRFYRYQDDNLLLSSISEKMQICTDIEKCSSLLNNEVIQHLTVILNKNCADITYNYFIENSTSGFDDEMMLFFSSDSEFKVEETFSRKSVMPDIEETIERGYPLIFNAIAYMNVLVGYACFSFNDYEITDYCKIPQIINAINTGIGGYINMQYQDFLKKRIERIYKFDHLTGLYNRLSFSYEYANVREANVGKSTKLTVVLADLDGLKIINDKFGHTAGDAAISIAAKALMDASPENALCVRFGGDEMMSVIFGDCDENEIMHKIRDNLKQNNLKTVYPFNVSVSLGSFSTKNWEKMDFEHIVKVVDDEMYKDKNSKKNVIIKSDEKFVR